jgi:hypothetical protein
MPDGVRCLIRIIDLASNNGQKVALNPRVLVSPPLADVAVGLPNSVLLERRSNTDPEAELDKRKYARPGIQTKHTLN